MNRNRKGHDLENIEHRFTDEDLAGLKEQKLFNGKWIILEKKEKRGAAYCYLVCDKPCKKFGILYLEIGEDNVTTIANQVDFYHQQSSLGYSHRFSALIDAGIINNHVFFMVVRIRAGPTLHDLLKCLSSDKMSVTTASFLAVDMISAIEILSASGWVLRNFDSKQWMLDIKTRQFYLADATDITVSSDKRHRAIDEIHLRTAESIDLHWKTGDLIYAPRSFVDRDQSHRMTELDMMEMMLYVLYDWTHGKLPWKSSKSRERIMEMKELFIENLQKEPEETNKVEQQIDVDVWFDIALRNFAKHLKVAKEEQEKLEKLPVRGGAWCPKGPRAGAQISTVNYRGIIDDFYKIVCSGRPAWALHWRDVMLDWDRKLENTPETSKMFEAYEKHQRSLEISEEWERLQATREHYTVMKNHTETEMAKNQAAIVEYLMPEEEAKEEPIDKKKDPEEEAAAAVVGKKRRGRKPKKKDDPKMELKDEVKDLKDFVVEESTSASSSAPKKRPCCSSGSPLKSSGGRRRGCEIRRK
ncbi:piRNA biogenesis factor prde-1 [Caenorhabditis elegans]|uniref:piRNA biogenesis factor prde-1 n=1 Tax=Caenorhabditis elegans TaxID=6239 RepID=PRDE1_CAEEL|nr:piRNA biogenesis factor prde-1 [Caenorhabditis elegans]O17828.3 RecName: Full=piRNA biogenesis factor prde-1; AltName: Full=piRNA silencing defective protein 1 [Caenorhabditis elegans]CAB04156.3 piRNA biogenesis factor prde-1 [Caenorhabditis elegans]|eukprot:NP_506866.3 piRNA biogenesis factor prde-1 [Caenorhabditis elegans]